MKKLALGLFIFGLTIQLSAQTQSERLEEVEVVAKNFKYINAVGTSEVAKPVKILERKVATLDITSLSFYEEEVEDYYVSFEIPEGKILAIYDKEGKVIQTTEKFENVNLPLKVSNAIVDQYPGWKITGDIYRVNYNRIKDHRTEKYYKLFIEKNGKHKRVKTDETGKFL